MLSGISSFDIASLVLAQGASTAAQATSKAASTSSSWDTVLPLVMLIVTIVGAILLGQFIARSVRMPEYGTRIATIIGVIACALLVIWTNWPPRFGVDLRGGINYIGQLNLAEFQGDNPPKAVDIIPMLKARTDPSGTKEIVIRPLGDDKIEVIMPQVDEAEADEVWNTLVQTGHLQFRIVADRTFHSAEMTLAADQAKTGNRSRFVYRTTAGGEQVKIAGWYDLAREVNPNQGDPDQPGVIKFMPQFNNLLRDRETGRLIDMNVVNAAGGAGSEARFTGWLMANNISSPQILLIEPRNERLNVEGEHLARVSVGTNNTDGSPTVDFVMSGEGARRMFALTNENKPREQGKFLLGIVLDNALHSAPSINSPISAQGVIEGKFTQKEVKDLELYLESGKISVALVKDPISKQYMESTLGEELKTKGLMAIGVSLAAVLLFMLFYYRLFAGGISCMALVLNLILTLGFVMAIKQPLTLTGLAGLVLTIGMSVDANVLIFERIREEMSRGASLRVAIQNGFERAFGTIIDANVTTLLTAVVLYVLGTDQIKGFSVTLIIGILTSMFTAVFVSRTVFDIAEKRHWIRSLSMTRMFGDVNWDFMGKFRIAAIGSVALIVIGMVALVSLGEQVLDIDLRGGSTAQVLFNEQTTRTEVERALRDSNSTFQGEPVDFVVSELRGSDNSTGREFKIDSSIPSFDETVHTERWPELDEVLTKVFAGKLRQRHVTWDPAGIQIEPVGENSVGEDSTGQNSTGQNSTGQNSATPNGNGAAANKIGQAGRQPGNGEFAVSALPNLAGGLLTLQDEQPATGTANQEGAGQAGDPGTGSSATESAAGTADVTPGQQDPLAAADPTPAAGDVPAADAQDDLPGVEVAPAQNPGQQYSATVTLEFDNDITAKSLRTQLIETSRRADLLLEENQIRLTSDLLKADESVQNASLKKWTVTMETASQGDAALILGRWSEEFNKMPYFKAASGVGKQIAGSTQMKAFAAVLASLLGIIAYIWVRFQNVAFGIAAVVALIHDVLVVVGAIALSHYVAGALGFIMVDKFKISLQIVAALLTVIGYSLNDTIVIFDRVREVRGKRLELTTEMVNTSVSATLSRTVLTSLTTFIVVLLLYFFGGPSIHGFAFSLVIGIVVGTYSTVFVASPMLVWLMNRFGLNAELNAELAAAKN